MVNAALSLATLAAVCAWVALPGVPARADSGRQQVHDDGAPLDNEPKKAPVFKQIYAEDFHPSLKGSAKEMPGLIIYGPEAAECVQSGPEGLRITLPSTYPRPRPGTGVVTDFGIKGDFEITVGFELVEDSPSPFQLKPKELNLVVVPNEAPQPDLWYQANQNRAALSFVTKHPNASGASFVAHLTKWNPVLPRTKWNNEIFDKIEEDTTEAAPASAKAGRLRLVRSGAELFFYVNERPEGEFTLLHQAPFGSKDLRNVRVLASTAAPLTALDIRVTDLRIRADTFFNPPLEPAGRTATSPAGPTGRTWTVMLLAMGLVLSALAMLLFCWLWLLRRTQPVTAERAEDAEPSRGGSTDV